MAIVIIFLRGGADGLALVPPVGEDAYHRLRPTTALPKGQGIALDQRHALHPDLAALRPLWDAGQLAIAPAAGIPEDSRSHFYAQEWLERGGALTTGGWLGRALAGSSDPLAAVAIGKELPESLRGAPTAVAIQGLAELSEQGDDELAARFAGLCAGDPLLAAPAANALAVHRKLAALAKRTIPGSYGDDDFGRGLAVIAGLIHADVGLRAATIDLDGWDSHIAMESYLPTHRRRLATALAAFTGDLGVKLATTSIVVLTEFGRRCSENASFGTDHGRAGCAFVIGGGVTGGLVGAWPGLDDLDETGDLRVTTDLRSLLLDALERQGPVDRKRVFPGFSG